MSEQMLRHELVTNSNLAAEDSKTYYVNWQQSGNRVFTDGNHYKSYSPTMFGTGSEQLGFTTKINCSWGGAYNGMFHMFDDSVFNVFEDKDEKSIFDVFEKGNDILDMVD